MFFIVNHENSIIAADADFLEGIGAESIYEAALLIKNGEVMLDEPDQSISYFQQNRAFTKVTLSTVLGDAYLYEIHEEEEDGEVSQSLEEEELFNLAVPQETLPEDTEEEIPETESSIEEILDFAKDESSEQEASVSLSEKDEEPLTLSEPNESIEMLLQSELSESPELHLDDTEESKIQEESLPDTTEEILGLLDTDEETLTIKEETDKEETDTDKGSLGIDLSNIEEDTPLSIKPSEEESAATKDTSALSMMDESLDIALPTSEASDNEETEEIETPVDDIKEDIQKVPSTNFREIAELIGVSEEEYMHFLNDFSKESAQLEPSLRSPDLRESREALSILKEASLLLHLPHITEKLNALSNATSDEKSSIIDSYITMVSQISNTGEVTSDENETPAITLPDESIEEKLSITDEIIEETDEEPVIIQSATNLMEDAAVLLDKVQPIPFDFSINEAADELTLPSSLVSEFVVDFIHQAKENLPVLQKAYEAKDMETIQTTAHMLKGASSNLRIVPMAETLYKLQFNEDLTQVPDLIALFSGQLKALTIQMDQV